MKKLITGLFLITGTSIGGGLLGLPIVTAQSGFLYSLALLFFAWALMTYTALLTLEVNFCFKPHTNVITMVRETLGKPGVVVCWTFYLFFLYALLAAYIAGGQDLLLGLLSTLHLQVPHWTGALIFVLIFGLIVVGGVGFVGRFNNLFVVLKLSALLLLIGLLLTHLNPHLELSGQFKALPSAVTIAITSFGFSVIIPSLRTYFEDDVQLLKRTIFLGSLIPLVCYILWEAAIFSVTPLSGPNGLTSLASSAHPLAQLLVSLNAATHSPTIFYLSHLFTAICILTAFLCVALGLSDYVSDGIQKQKVGKHRWSIALMTFLPPLLCVIYFPRAFVLFLSLGGLFCVLLQALLPALMSWRTRYHQKRLTPYQVSGGMMGLILTILASLGVAIIAIFHP